MITQQNIADRYGLALITIRQCAMKSDFPPASRIAGKTGRLKLYCATEISMWWRNRKDGRRLNGGKRRRAR